MSKGVEIQLSKMISEDRVVDLISSKKENVLKELVQVISTSKAVGNKLDFYKVISEREKLASTGLGMGVAIPHAQSKTISDFVMAVGRKAEGISFESVDGQPVSLVIMLGAPENKADEFLRTVAKVVLIFKNSKFRKKILEARSRSDIVHLFKDK